MSKLSDVVIHSSNLPFNGTTLECDGDELRPDGTCAKCERVNQRIAARFQPEDERVKEALNKLFSLLAKASNGQWCFNSLSRDATEFQNSIEELNRLRLLPVQPAQSDRVRWLLHQIISDLPKSRDWLDPQIEAEAREVTGVQLVQPAASTERK